MIYAASVSCANIYVYIGYGTELLTHTFVPLIRLNIDLYAWSSPLQVEISWSNPIGIYKTALLAAYSNVDTRVRPFVLFIKYWSKARKLTDTRQGGMGSFAWCLLCIYFLMKVTKPSVVPNLQSIAKETKYMYGYDVSFSKDVVISDNWSRSTKVRIHLTLTM